MFKSVIESKHTRTIVSGNGDVVLRCHIGMYRKDDWKRIFSVFLVESGDNSDMIYHQYGGIIDPILLYLNYGTPSDSVSSIMDMLSEIKNKYWIQKPDISLIDPNGDIATVPLTQGKVAIVNKEMEQWVLQWKWHAYLCNDSLFYAGRRADIGSSKRVQMHRAIIDPTDGMDCDHINGNALDNRVQNLRSCTRAQNAMNTGKGKNNTSGYKGVNWNCSHKAWIARIMTGNKHIFLGDYETPLDAARAYNVAAIKYHGEFARLNILPDTPGGSPSFT